MPRFLASTLFSLSFFIATIHAAAAPIPLARIEMKTSTDLCCTSRGTWSSFQDDRQGTTFWAFQTCAKICCGNGEQGPVPGATGRKIPYPPNWCEAGLGYVLCCTPALEHGGCRLNGAQTHYLQVNSMDISQDKNTCLQTGVGGWKYCAKQGTTW
ncbi:hypothetical protein COCMIDRAFT_34210 [Bipolaris oryzae ATCC 44560]|uniref:Uncharacterized protein n=1 Tax=Bipolaris oryzae ATCC 44560 TaxID=930090 RepID=W6Z9E1_COCMI|nr:uncharacterized protein COCMIDRAFT_34210 [Bipolaris oryzae ATCC 44560]EUC48337.1 hypothetical protein COCMIDRAFT_34210 [Bipolaris oryzae ATCC 44560]